MFRLAKAFLVGKHFMERPEFFVQQTTVARPEKFLGNMCFGAKLCRLPKTFFVGNVFVRRPKHSGAASNGCTRVLHASCMCAT